MARNIPIGFNGKKVKLTASFDAAKDICEQVHDLLLLFQDQQRALIYLKMGQPYKPSFQFTMETVADILQIAIQSAGEDASTDDVKAHMVEIGLDTAQKLAQDYLSLFFAEPEEKPDKEGEKEPGK